MRHFQIDKICKAREEAELSFGLTETEDSVVSITIPLRPIYEKHFARVESFVYPLMGPDLTTMSYGNFLNLVDEEDIELYFRLEIIPLLKHLQ